MIVSTDFTFHVSTNNNERYLINVWKYTAIVKFDGYEAFTRERHDLISFIKNESKTVDISSVPHKCD